MSRKRLSAMLTIFFAVSIVLMGCSGSNNEKTESSNKEQPIAKKEGKDITIAVASDFISMDPHDTNDTLSYSAQKTMLEGLVGFDKDMKVIPVLAEEYSVNEAATEFTFKLRQGVTFHDGEPFNAEAVKANIDRLANPDNNLKRHSLFSVVKETQVVDEYTVKVVLSEPFGPMINNFAHPAAMMLSPKAMETYGKEVSRNPVGTGQYIFKDWQPGDHLTVTKNENYWNGSAKVDSITFKPSLENGSRVAMLQAGEADFIYPVPSEQVKAIDGKDGIVVENGPSIITRYLSMNTMKEPFNDVRVRQAINYAINKEAFLGVVMNGYASELKSVIAPNTQFYSEQESYGFNVEKAKELLKEAGYENGFNTKVWGQNNSQAVKGMEFIQQQLAQIGIKVEVVPMETGTMTDSIWSVTNPEDADIELYYGGWSPSTGDADWGIRPLVGGTEAFPPSSYNTAYYNNEDVNRLIKEGLATADPEKRNVAYKELQEIVWKDAPWAFLASDDTLYGMKNYLEGIYLLPDGSLSLENIEIKQ
ncbi:glutathione ABC transporter substrate-binding protein [Cytobacillus depressus]|uniref:Glutathione-binding protein GsiB n=1 Tax=Cytobacillus depressus TaxID=1602942 RepID=A0A6L3VAT9_9BACI|nr:glutathione ABC transporter substrate-binding protein [Cytobacillus depressus]KAB2336622.1 glutathione ABC transporter substrate-binding protein [Cytobacillus depressus]